MGFLVLVECGRAVSHRSQSVVVLLVFDNFVIVRCLTGTAGGMNGAVSMLIYLFHVGLPRKAFYRSRVLFLRFHVITQI